MRRKGEAVVPVSAEDIVNCLEAIQEDAGCETRITIRLAPGGTHDLLIRVEAYTDCGSLIGVAREISVYRPRPSQGLLGYLMGQLHRVYHNACSKARGHGYGENAPG